VRGEGIRELYSFRALLTDTYYKKNFYRRNLLRLFFILFFPFTFWFLSGVQGHFSPLTNPAFAENKIAPDIKSIDVSSDTFDMIIKDSIMTFSKNVRIKSENFEAQCNRAQVYIEAKTGKVKKIVMSGKVKLQKENSQINGEKVTFEIENQKLTVEGSVKTKIKFSE
jgi:hypothetical protein